MARGSLLLLNPNSLEVDAEPGYDELNRLLDRPGPSPVVFAGERELAEAIWDAEKHPRWPPGTKDWQGKDIGGEYMRIGQQFMADGHRWEIGHVVGGHLIANEASGNLASAETRVFDTKPMKFDDGTHPSLPGAVVAAPVKLHSGKGMKAVQSNTVLLDAHTHPETHDPKIKLPDGSPLSADEWKLFGKADQLYYVELAKRYGAWEDGGSDVLNGVQSAMARAKKVMTKAHSEGYSDATTLVEQAFNSQKGSSEGYTLNFASLFLSGYSQMDLDGAWRKYQRAREVEGDLNGVIAWDLFNRLHAPDIMLRHKTAGDQGFFGDVIAGKKPLMSGLSSSWTSNWKSWKSNTIAFATPIRALGLATDLVGYANGYEHEHEMATADRLKLDPEKAAFWFPTQVDESNSNPIWNWLAPQINQNPKGGAIMAALAAHLHGKHDLPLPPADPDFQLKYMAASGAPGPAKAKGYAIPPIAFMKEVEASIADDPGETITEKVPIKQLDLKPGDVIQTSTPGTRYLVIKDTDAPTGLSYLALAKGSPGDYESGEKKFTFSSWDATRYKVDKHFDIPEPPVVKKPTKKEPAGPPPYNPADFEPKGDLVKIKNFETGDALRYNGDDWKVIDTGQSKVTVQSLSNPKQEATFNADWKTQKLQPVVKLKAGDRAIFEGQVVTVDGSDAQGKTGVAHWKLKLPDGGLVSVPQSEVATYPSFKPEHAQKGDIFVRDGKKMVVTTVKGKEVRAREQTPGATVEGFSQDDPLLDSLFRPDDYVLGAKAKIGKVPNGTLFSGSPVKNRPYVVLGSKPDETDVHVLNLETGETSVVSGGKSYRLLIAPSDAEPAVNPPVVGTPVGSKFAAGDKVKQWGDLAVGDIVKNQAANQYQVLENGAEGVKLKMITGSASDQWEGWVPAKTGLEGLASVVFVGNAADAGEHSMETPPAPTPIDPGTLPWAITDGGMMPFKTKGNNESLFNLTEGQVFKDKAGNVWKVKKTGYPTVVTQGTANYKQTNVAYVKPVDQPFVDSSPPLNIPAAGILPNTAQATLGELGLQPGDTFALGGNKWTIKNVETGGGFGADADDGAFDVFTPYIVPAQYQKNPHPVASPPVGGEQVGGIPKPVFDAAQEWMGGNGISQDDWKSVHDGALDFHKSGATWANAYDAAAKAANWLTDDHQGTGTTLIDAVNDAATTSMPTVGSLATWGDLPIGVVVKSPSGKYTIKKINSGPDGGQVVTAFPGSTYSPGDNFGTLGASYGEVVSLPNVWVKVPYGSQKASTLGLVPGDQFIANSGNVYEIVSYVAGDAHPWKVKNVNTGQSKAFIDPPTSSYLKAGSVAAPSTALSSEPTTMADLPVGAQFENAGAPGVHGGWYKHKENGMPGPWTVVKAAEPPPYGHITISHHGQEFTVGTDSAVGKSKVKPIVASVYTPAGKLSYTTSSLTPANLFPEMTLADHKGKLIYKSNADTWFPLGEDEPLKIKTTKVKKIALTGVPDVTGWEPTGETVALKVAPVGSVFSAPGKIKPGTYMVLAHGPGGTHSMALDSPLFGKNDVIFSSTSPQVKLQGPPKPKEPEQPVTGEDIAPGTFASLAVGDHFHPVSSPKVTWVKKDSSTAKLVDSYEPGSVAAPGESALFTQTTSVIPFKAMKLADMPDGTVYKSFSNGAEIKKLNKVGASQVQLKVVKQGTTKQGYKTDVAGSTWLTDMGSALHEIVSMPGEPTGIKPGDMASWSSLPVGAVVQTAAGSYHVEKVEHSEKATIVKVLKAHTMKSVGHQFTMGAGLYKVISLPASDAGPSESFGLPIESFLWHKGGTGQTYEKLSEQPPGVLFQDKAGDAYRVVQQAGPTTLISKLEDDGYPVITVPHTFLDKNGKSKPVRVKLITDMAVADAAKGVGAKPKVWQMVSAAELKPGDVFKNDSGGVFKITSGKYFEKLSGNGVDSGDLGSSALKQYKLMPKPHSFEGAITYGDLSKGDHFTTPVPGMPGAAGAKSTHSPTQVYTVDGIAPEPGWSHSPTPMKVSAMQLSPGDQFYDDEGDLFTVQPNGTTVSWPSKVTGGDLTMGLAGTALTTTKWKQATVPAKGKAKVIPEDVIPDYTEDEATLTPTGSAGGTTGAQFADGPGGKWLLKTYGGDEDRVATELLANAIYRDLGVKTPKAGTYMHNGNVALAYPLMPGTSQSFSGQVGPADNSKKAMLGKDVMADMLVGNYDFAGLEDDNVLWNGDEPTRVDQGGTFEFRAQGAAKDFGPVPDWSIMQKGQGKTGVIVSDQQLREQAHKIASKLTEQRINDLVAAAPFKDKEMQERVRKDLLSRVAWLDQFSLGGEPVPGDVDLAADAPTKVVPEFPIKPYTTKTTSAGHFMPKLADLDKGAEFRDKTGTLYVVDSKSVGESHVKELLGGSMLTVPHVFTNAHGKQVDVRVKIAGGTSIPPNAA